MMQIRTTMTDTATSLLDAVKAGLPSTKVMGALASKGKMLIAQRTLAGKSETGSAFEAYRTAPYYAPVEKRPPGYPTPSGGEITKSGKSAKYPSYAAYKTAQGFGAKVQLSVSNQMLSDIDWVVQSPTRAVLFFASRLSAAKAHGQHTGYYPFFGFGDAASVEQMSRELAGLFQDIRAKAQAEMKRRAEKSR